MRLLTRTPAAGDACVDAVLRLVFDRPPRLTGRGAIKIVGSDGEPCQEIDLADPAAHRRNIGAAISDRGTPHFFHDYPVIITGHTATIVPRQALDHDQTYAVTIGPDVFAGFSGIIDQTTWRFTTGSSLPASTARITVAADGSADFCTVQGAIDAVPIGNPTPVQIQVAPGHYNEIIYVREDRPGITIRGTDRDTTVISYPNNNALNGQASDSHSPLRRLGDRDLHNGWRATVGVDAPDFTLENITIENSTPVGGSQAEAFRGNNDRIVLNRVTLIGHQDTLRLQGKGFVTNSLIVGDVDFVWGTGTAFHNESEFRSAGPGYLMQIRNGAGEHGHVVVNSRLTRVPDLPDATVHLARTDVTAFPHSQAIFVDTAMDNHIRPERWLITPPESASDQVQFQCMSEQDAGRWRDPAYVLDGWVPLTVNVDQTQAGVNAPIRVNWSAPPGHSAADELLVLPVGEPDAAPVWRLPVGSAETTGVRRIPVRTYGTFRVAYRSNGESDPSAYSAEFHVQSRTTRRPVAIIDEAVAATRSAEIHTLPDGVAGIDVEQLITIRSVDDVARRRQQLINYAFKGELPSGLPEVVEGVDQPDLATLRHDRIDAVTTRLPYGVVATSFLVRPEQQTSAAAPLALYFAGHGNPRSPKYHLPQLRAMQALLDRGYAVGAVDMPFLGWNSPSIADPADPQTMITPEDHRVHEILADYESPSFSALRFFLEPPIQLLNHGATAGGTVAIGFSGGAWTTTVLAAIDDRITHSFPVAGSSPFYLRPYPRQKPNFGDWEQRRESLPDFYALAGYLDLYVLGAAGPGRTQTQVLNRFDPVCFAGVGFRSYAPVVEHRVATLGDGDWQVLDDPTHGEHQVSPYALSTICWNLDERSRRSHDDQPH